MNASRRGVRSGEKPPSARSGPHRLPPEVVAFDQRERLMASFVTVVAEKGYEATTITDIVTGAAISRQTFYKHFDGKEACCLASFDALQGHMQAQMKKAAEPEAEWEDRVAAAVDRMIAFLAENPEAARLLLVESAAVGTPMRPQADRWSERMVEVLELDRGRRLPPYASSIEPIEEPILTGVNAMLSSRVVAGGSASIDDISSEAIVSVLWPYIGFEQAAKVAARHRR